MQTQFLSAEKATKMLDIHPMTLKKKSRSGEIPAWNGEEIRASI